MLSLMVMLQDILIMYRRHRSNPCHVVGVVRCPQTVKVRPLSACWPFVHAMRWYYDCQHTCTLALNLAWVGEPLRSEW